MKTNGLMLEVIKRKNELQLKKTEERLLSCNEELKKYNHELTLQDVRELTEFHHNALHAAKRIEMKDTILDRLIMTFAASPYIGKSEFVCLCEELTELFYDIRNMTGDSITDDGILLFMKQLFDGKCRGSMDLLQDEMMKLTAYVNCGGTPIEYMKGEEE